MPTPRRLFPLAIAAAGALVVLAPGIFLGRTPLLRDLFLYFHPWTDHLVRRVHAGELPLWNPLLYGGESLAGQIHGRLWYPSFPLYLALPYRLASLMDLFAHLALAGALAALFLRRLGVGSAGAATGAAAFALNGWMLAKLEAPMKIGVIAWMPLALLGFAEVARGRRARGAAWIGLGVGLQILAGYPPIAAYAISAEAIAGLAILIGGTGVRRAGAIAGGAAAAAAGFVLALLISAVALLPFLEDARLAAYWRPLPEDLAAVRSLPPVHLFGLLLPRFTGLPGWERYWGGELSVYTAGALYLGLPVALFALLSPWLARPRSGSGGEGERLALAAALGLLIAAALAFVVALGRYAPLFGWLHAHVEFFSRTRWPSQSLGVAAGALALAAGIGLDGASRRGERTAFRSSLGAGMACLAAGCGVLAYLPSPGGPALAWIRGALIPGQEAAFESLAAGFLRGDLMRASIVSLAAAGVLLGRPGRWGLIALLVAADLTLFGRALVPFTAEDLFAEAPRLGALGELAARRERTLRVGNDTLLEAAIYGSADPRIYREARRGLVAGTAILAGVPAIDGAEPLQSARNAFFVGALGRPRFAEDARRRAARMLGVRALVAPSGWDGGDAAALDAAPDSVGYTLLPGDPVPFAYLVRRVSVIADDAQQIARLLDPAFDPEREAVVAERPAGVALEDAAAAEADSAPGAVPPACRVERPRAERLRVATESDRDALLVIRESHHPGWRATVDGRPVTPIRVNDLFLGVPLPAGRHDVALAFAPGSFRAGLALSGAGLGVLAVLLLAPGRRRR